MAAQFFKSRKREPETDVSYPQNPFDKDAVRALIRVHCQDGNTALFSLPDEKTEIPEPLLSYLEFYAKHYQYFQHDALSNSGSNSELIAFSSAQHGMPNFFCLDVECDAITYEIVGQYFLPKKSSRQNKPKATVLLLHGYYDHVGIYQHIIEHLLQKNYAVITYDHPGHGLSSGERGSIESFNHYQHVLQSVIEYLLSNEQLPAPYILIGQSMGAAICMEYIKQQRGDTIFGNVVLFAPLIRPQRWNKAKWLFHGVKQIRFIKHTPRQFTINSHDKNFLHFLQTDPLQPKVLPVAWVDAMRHWFLAFEKTKAVFDIQPISVIQAEADGTVNWQYNLPIIKRLFPKISVSMIEGARHQMMNESEAFRQLILQSLDESLLQTKPLKAQPLKMKAAKKSVSKNEI